MMTELQDLSELILWINQQGWSPATSTNYSHRDLSKTNMCYVSESGIDKSKFTPENFLLMSLDGEVDSRFEGRKSSAETEIHLKIYQQTDANVILHTHSLSDTLLSRLDSPNHCTTLENYELLKGLRNISTHLSKTIVPIFDNDQNIAALSERLVAYLKTNRECQGFLIESHGFYTWGRDLAEAKRHLEVFQFLFSCELELRKLRR